MGRSPYGDDSSSGSLATDGDRKTAVADVNRVRDKVVLIVGGASEDGRTLATELAARGAHIALVYRPQAWRAAEETRRQVEAYARRCLLIPAQPQTDARQFARQVVRQVIATLGGLDVFIDYSSAPAPRPSLSEQATTARTAVGRGAENGCLFPSVDMLAAALNELADHT